MKIKFVPSGQEIDVDPNKTLLKLCTENQIEIRSICKGVPSCAECRVRVVAGENNVLPPNQAELNLIGTSYFLDGRRLSCQVRCFGNITVDLTEQIERQDNPNKKVRGFRSAQKSVETQAVQGTLVLEEKPIHPSRRDSSLGNDEGEEGGDSVQAGEDENSQQPGQQPQRAQGGGGGGRRGGGGNRGGGGGNQQRRDQGPRREGGGQQQGQGQGKGGGGGGSRRGGRNRNRGPKPNPS